MATTTFDEKKQLKFFVNIVNYFDGNNKNPTE